MAGDDHRAGRPLQRLLELVDFGVVGDLKTVLPQATEGIAQRKG